MRQNKNRWVPSKDPDQFIVWFEQNFYRVVSDNLIHQSSDKSLEQFYTGICARIYESELNSIESFIASNVDYNQWRTVKARYAREKYRFEARITKIDIREDTLKKLKVLKKIHGLSSLSDVIAELVDGVITTSTANCVKLSTDSVSNFVD